MLLLLFGACAPDPAPVASAPYDGCMGGAERCNGADDDCDGEVDEADALGCRASYVDADGDGIGAEEGACVCEAGDGYAFIAGDCDEENADIQACEDVSIADILDLPECVAWAEDIPGYVREVGWFDGDAVPDLVVHDLSIVEVPLAGSWDGSLLAEAVSPWDDTPYVFRAGDLDGDGLDELINVDYRITSDEQVNVYYYREDVAVWRSPVAGADAWDHRAQAADAYTMYTLTRTAFLVDTDADSDDEVFLVSSEGPAWILDGEGADDTLLDSSNAFAERAGTDLYASSHAEVGDVDGDGVEDLYYDGVFTYGPIQDTWPGGLALDIEFAAGSADLDGDGVRELIAETLAGVEVGEAPTTDTTWDDQRFATFLRPEDSDTFGLYTGGDVDGDGAEELVLVTRWTDGRHDVAVYSGLPVGEVDVSSARRTWSFGSPLEIVPEVVSPAHEAVGLWLYDLQSREYAFGYLQPW